MRKLSQRSELFFTEWAYHSEAKRGIHVFMKS